MATIDLVGIGALVQPPFATRLEFEVFHRVGDEYHFAINFGVFEEPSRARRPPDQRMVSLFVFLIARLFAHQHDARPRRTFTGNDLCRILVKRAARAFLLGVAQRRQRFDG